MTILPYKLTTTKDQLISRAGLSLPAQLMDTLSLSQHIDQHFPQPQSNRGFKPSVFVQTLILMQHDENFHLTGKHQTINTACEAVNKLFPSQKNSWVVSGTGNAPST